MNKSVVCPVCNAIYLQDNLEDQICMECGFVNTPDNVIPANTLTPGQKISVSLDGYISGIEDNIPFPQLFHGDCLDIMPNIKRNSVDMVLVDLPYGTTACKWDAIIPFDKLWEQYERIVKPNGAIVFTASQPFTSALVMSKPKWFRHEWIWKKNRGSNFALLKWQPFKEHESVLVFSKETANYYPIMEERSENGKSRCAYTFNNKVTSETIDNQTFYNQDGERRKLDENLRNPSSVQNFNTEVGLHPTQKPIKLFEYLIQTYTKVGDIVMDNTMGSGTTGVACRNTRRSFIGIEKDDKYFAIAKERIESEPNNDTTLFD